MGPNVNKPSDIKQKEADVNRKLQIYGIISAFKSGKVPSVSTFCLGDSFAQKSALTYC